MADIKIIHEHYVKFNQDMASSSPSSSLNNSKLDSLIDKLNTVSENLARVQPRTRSSTQEKIDLESSKQQTLTVRKESRNADNEATLQRIQLNSFLKKEAADKKLNDDLLKIQKKHSSKIEQQNNDAMNKKEIIDKRFANQQVLNQQKSNKEILTQFKYAAVGVGYLAKNVISAVANQSNAINIGPYQGATFLANNNSQIRDASKNALEGALAGAAALAWKAGPELGIPATLGAIGGSLYSEYYNAKEGAKDTFKSNTLESSWRLSNAYRLNIPETIDNLDVNPMLGIQIKGNINKLYSDLIKEKNPFVNYAEPIISGMYPKMNLGDKDYNTIKGLTKGVSSLGYLGGVSENELPALGNAIGGILNQTKSQDYMPLLQTIADNQKTHGGSMVQILQNVQSLLQNSSIKDYKEVVNLAYKYQSAPSSVQAGMQNYFSSSYLDQLKQYMVAKHVGGFDLVKYYQGDPNTVKYVQNKMASFDFKNPEALLKSSEFANIAGIASVLPTGAANLNLKTLNKNLSTADLGGVSSGNNLSPSTKASIKSMTDNLNDMIVSRQNIKADNVYINGNILNRSSAIQRAFDAANFSQQLSSSHAINNQSSQSNIVVPPIEKNISQLHKIHIMSK